MLEHVKSLPGDLRRPTRRTASRPRTSALEIESHLKAIEVLKAEKREAEANLKTLAGGRGLGRKLGPAVNVDVAVKPRRRAARPLAPGRRRQDAR
jgi:hypothetical protein